MLMRKICQLTLFIKLCGKRGVVFTQMKSLVLQRKYHGDRKPSSTDMCYLGMYYWRVVWGR